MLLLCSTMLLNAQPSRVYDNLSVKSEILKMDRKFSIYLPAGYEDSQRSYPVLYLLHGAWDNHLGWLQFGEVQYIADKAIAEGRATPMIIVMPDAGSVNMGYFNYIDGTYNYEDFFFKEFIPYIEKNYRCRTQRQYRAISGLSMGGGGTFYYAVHHPEMFASACPLSAFLGPLKRSDEMRFVGDTSKVNADMREAYYLQHSMEIINNLTEEQLTAVKSVRWFFDCGDDDSLYEANALVHILFRKKEIRHEFRMRDGGHRWPYWRESLPLVLEFISTGFHQW